MVLMAWLSHVNISWAQADLHLQFHMGLGSKENMIWGGTVANKGDQPNGPTFIIVTPVDAHCVAAGAVSYQLPSIAPGMTENVRIPLQVTTFHHYRFTLHAFDEQGVSIPFIDDNAATFAKKEKENSAYCSQQKKYHFSK